jgi:hypothetical protein
MYVNFKLYLYYWIFYFEYILVIIVLNLIVLCFNKYWQFSILIFKFILIKFMTNFLYSLFLVIPYEGKLFHLHRLGEQETT